MGNCPGSFVNACLLVHADNLSFDTKQFSKQPRDTAQKPPIRQHFY